MARVLLVDILTVLFGIGTWVCVNALWVETPLLVQTLPEGWNLPSYMSVIVQIANIGPITYTVLNSFFPKSVTEKKAIYLSMMVETVAAILMAFLWTETAYIFGSSRSVGLLSLAFFFALVDCSSRVLFLPFMTKFQAKYLLPYFIGEGLSSFVPAIFSLIQGVGGNPECRLVNTTSGTGTTTEITQEWQSFTDDPTFSVQTFFILVFGIMLISIGAFHLLNYKSLVRNALSPVYTLGTPQEHLNSPERRLSNSDYKSTSPSDSRKSFSIHSANGTKLEGKESSMLENLEQMEISPNTLEDLVLDEADVAVITSKNNNLEIKITKPDALFSHVSKPLFITLLIVQIIICGFSNGVFPSIQSYSCLPYGNVAYHWAVVLSSMTNPIVCFASMALPKPTQTSILSAAVLSLGVASYTFTTALESPEPPLVGQLSGEIILVVTWVLLVGLFTYVRVSVATVLRAEGRQGLFFCGAATQIGSAVGSLITFSVVNFTETFKSYNACQGLTP